MTVGIFLLFILFQIAAIIKSIKENNKKKDFDLLPREILTEYSGNCYQEPYQEAPNRISNYLVPSTNWMNMVFYLDNNTMEYPEMPKNTIKHLNKTKIMEKQERIWVELIFTKLKLNANDNILLNNSITSQSNIMRFAHKCTLYIHFTQQILYFFT